MIVIFQSINIMTIVEKSKVETFLQRPTNSWKDVKWIQWLKIQLNSSLLGTK